MLEPKNKPQKLQVTRIALDENAPECPQGRWRRGLRANSRRRSAEVQPTGILGPQGTAGESVHAPPSTRGLLLDFAALGPIVSAPPFSPDWLSTQVVPSFPLRTPVGSLQGCAASPPSTSHEPTSFTTPSPLLAALYPFASSRRLPFASLAHPASPTPASIFPRHDAFTSTD
jgi:hypothetical protein